VLVWYFRDPKREVPASPLAVVAPADGVVVGIETVEDFYLGREAINVQIIKPWYSIISLRSPMEGKIQKQWYGASANAHAITHGASQTVANVSASEHTNTIGASRFAQWVQSDEGDDICVTLQPLSGSRFFRCYLHAGERVGQGQRCGIFPMAAMLEVKLPINSHLHVKVGDAVKAGSDKLATLIH